MALDYGCTNFDGIIQLRMTICRMLKLDPYYDSIARVILPLAYEVYKGLQSFCLFCNNICVCLWVFTVYVCVCKLFLSKISQELLSLGV